VTLGGETVAFTARLAGDRLTLTIDGADMVFVRGGGKGATTAGEKRARAKPARGKRHRSPDGYELRAPRGWKMADRGGRLLLGSDTEAGLIVVGFEPGAFKPRRSAAEVTRSMAAEGVSIRFARGRMRRGSWIAEGRGRAANGKAAWARLILMRARHGTLAILATSTARDAANLRARGDQIRRSVRFFAPTTSAASRAIAGVYTHYQDTSGMTASGGFEATISLCPGGRYGYRAASSFAGNQGGAHASETRERGRWRASGTARSGTLVITHDSGKTERLRYRRTSNGIVIGSRDYLRAGRRCR
jgi:hypothetical protein